MSNSAQTVPLSVALVAGALVALNPCSLPLLLAFFVASPESLNLATFPQDMSPRYGRRGY